MYERSEYELPPKHRLAWSGANHQRAITDHKFSVNKYELDTFRITQIIFESCCINDMCRVEYGDIGVHAKL